MQEENSKGLEISDSGQRFNAPTSIAELEQIYIENPDAQILSGATDIGLWVTKQHRQLAHFIHIGRVAELEQIEKTDSHIKIGAGVTHEQAMTYLAEDYPALREIWARFGSAQVRALAGYVQILPMPRPLRSFALFSGVGGRNFAEQRWR